MAQICAGCTQDLLNKLHLRCVICNSKYDLECANISTNHFNNTMTPNNKKQWKCPSCLCKMPKMGNINTPIRPHTSTQSQQPPTPNEENNITIRRKTYPSNDSTTFENQSLLGDTMCLEEGTPSPNNPNIKLSLQNLSEIIMMRLKENNESIITDLRNTIQTEINKAVMKITEDFEQKTKYLSKQNEQRKQEIEEINTKIENLLKENEKLKQEIKILSQNSTCPVTQCVESNYKKIVIYGLTEYYKEPEADLHNRIIEIFRDIQQVNLMGYIENIYRLGRNKSNVTRPLVIELISKRMVKYIINHSHYFKGTRLSISEFLDDNSRKERQQMREEMIKARKNGLHAVIRNNQLYVEGKMISSQDGTQNTKLPSDINRNSEIYQQHPTSTNRYSEVTSQNNNSFRKPRPTF